MLHLWSFSELGVGVQRSRELYLVHINAKLGQFFLFLFYFIFFFLESLLAHCIFKEINCLVL